jgi:uncharacterized protein (TIGR02594 family)
MDQPAWMAEAWPQLGVREVPGRRHSRDVLEFFRDAGRDDVARDEVPWCAAFVGACLERADRPGTGSLLARSYLDWGRVLAAPRLGAIVVLSRGKDPGAGHVGFWIGETEDKHILLGGNQSDAVSVAAFAKDRLLGFRWPREFEAPHADTVGSGAVLTFEGALAHVLEMEGGYTDDPDDPGGPTNKGVILKVFCRHTGRVLNEFTRDSRVAELRTIGDDVVRDIYRTRYWAPSRAGEMTPAIAFMHFDASVNQGLTGAARLLQQALKRQHADLEVDGEIGPLTMAAIRDANETRLLGAYADARRAKYRSLRHFWKFGRGWLNRVDRTEARARQLLGGAFPSPKETTQPTKGNEMTSSIETTAGSKWWGSSMTIWGAALTALSTVVPILGPAFGFEVTPDVVRQAGEQFVSVLQAIGGLAGTIMTIYGRTRATKPLERRSMQLHL